MAIWFKGRPKSDQQQRTLERGAAKVGGEPRLPNAAECMNVSFGWGGAKTHLTVSLHQAPVPSPPQQLSAPH